MVTHPPKIEQWRPVKPSELGAFALEVPRNETWPIHKFRDFMRKIGCHRWKLVATLYDSNIDRESGIENYRWEIWINTTDDEKFQGWQDDILIWLEGYNSGRWVG